MPTYEYVCDACEHRFERFQGISEPPVKKCPECGKRKVRRLISRGAGIVFKGSGFYATDYRKGPPPKEEGGKEGGEKRSDTEGKSGRESGERSGRESGERSRRESGERSGRESGERSREESGGRSGKESSGGSGGRSGARGGSGSASSDDAAGG